MEGDSRASSSFSIDSFVGDEFDFDFVLLKEVECLSNWEFVDLLDDQNACGDCVKDGLASDLQSDVLPLNSLPVSLREFFDQNHCEENNFDYGCSDDLEADEDASLTNGEDAGDVYDLDDELVPWSVARKFERQRMRKVDKRQIPKMCSSRKSPHLLLRHGCVRGKHGLGLKSNC